MDSPEPPSTATVSAAATATADSPPVQESPFSNYISNLSPIKSAKAAHPAQGFPVIVSPPLVFKSPQVVPHHETKLLQRSLLSHISSTEIPKNDAGKKKLADRSDDLEESVTYCSRLITDTQRDNGAGNSPQGPPSSSSGCVDEYLYDPVDIDCASSVNLGNPNVKQANDVLQSSVSSLTNSHKVILKCDDQNHVRVELGMPQPLSERAELEIDPIQVEEDQTDRKRPSNECPNIRSNLQMDHAPEEKLCDATRSRIVEAHEDYDQNARATLQVAPHFLEASQLQHGLSKRCLQFEEPQQKTIVNRTPSPNQVNNVNGSGSPAYATALEGPDSSLADLTDSDNYKQILKLSRPMTSLSDICYSVKSPMVVSKPLGIGLHLNSIVNASPVGHSATASIKSTSILSSHQVDQNSNCSKQSNLDEDVAIIPDDRMVESKALQAVSFAAGKSFHTAEPLNVLPVEGTPLNKRKFNSEHADNFEEFSQLSPTKKKRKKSSSIDGDGCKRCNCKKTKCLKLYCDCFAAGIYCAKPCACQDCFNRSEYEETVTETRQQIESRNPLAFAPKIVQQVTEFAAEDRNQVIPSLARHKRGCNCKKSMCLKKYCECFQANVGCSSECRCEGCKNVYGRKEEYGMAEDIVSNRVHDERLEVRVDDKLGMMTTNKDVLHAELHDLHHLTPSTPSFQHSDHGKDAPKSRFISSRYAPSPESDYSTLPLYAKSTISPRSSYSNDMVPERTEILDMDSLGHGLEYSITEMAGRFSPRCNALADICDLTPLQNFSNVASSASSKARDWAGGSRLQLCPGSGGLSSGWSLCWRGSPITPMARLGETKNQGNESNSSLYDILEDDTPEILKGAATPIASVKASSPNKKRVSPPRNHMHGIRSSSSGSLKSGRRFILKAVPSFPPLTPCINPKGSTDEKQ